MERVEILKDIMDDVREYFLKDGNSYIIAPGYEYFREIITLYAKQHNLLESILLLLDNNMSEEAYILTRTMINNYFLIGYLINDGENHNRLKKYHIQPVISQIYLLKNMKNILKTSPFKENEQIQEMFKETEINKKINELKNFLKDNGFKQDEKPFKIIDLAKHGFDRSFEMYATCYAEGSAYEHSDISSLDVYKKPVLDEYNKNEVFTLYLGATNEELKTKILNITSIVYCDCFNNIMKHITEKEEHLKINYDIDRLALTATKVAVYFE